MSEEKQQEPTEYKLLIEFVCKRSRRFLSKATHLVQNKPFKFGFRVKNIDNTNSPPGKIKEVHFISTISKIQTKIDEEFSFPGLNPNEETVLWWGDPLTIVFKGEVWIECGVEPEDRKKTTFVTFQYDQNCIKQLPYKERNHWGDASFIHGELEQQQAKTNILMFILTVSVFLDGVLGLDTIFKAILSWFRWFLLQFALLIIKIM